jgi:hypothetical protein
MPRTRGKSTRYNPNLPPLQRFETLDLVDKIICWKYYQHTASTGEEGWNPAQVGSVFHLRSSDYVADIYSESQFRHKARSMVTLAEEFAKQNQAPPRPQPPPRSSTTETRPKDLPNLPDLQRRTTMLQSPRTPGSAPPRAKVEVDTEEQSLTVPTSFGSFKEFNYTTRKTSTLVLIRQLCHSALEKTDVEYEWITPRKLKIRMAWHGMARVVSLC